MPSDLNSFTTQRRSTLMFEFAIDRVSFEMPAISIAVSPPHEEHRYCPVLIPRGRHTQYLQHEQPFLAPVVKPSVLYSAFTNNVSISFDWTALFRRYGDIVITQKVAHKEYPEDIPWDLLDYITDAIPEYKPEDIRTARAFHNVTEEELPNSWHEAGMTLVWNERFVPKDHPARKHCGEGPFLVLRDESYFIKFTREPGNRNKISKISKIELGNNRIVLESLSDHRMTIAHGGYFKMITAKILHYPEKITQKAVAATADFVSIDEHAHVA